MPALSGLACSTAVAAQCQADQLLHPSFHDAVQLLTHASWPTWPTLFCMHSEAVLLTVHCMTCRPGQPESVPQAPAAICVPICTSDVLLPPPLFLVVL